MKRRQVRCLSAPLIVGVVALALMFAEVPVSAAGTSADKKAPTEPVWTGYGTPVNLCSCADAELAAFADGKVRMYYSVLGGEQPIRSKLSTDGGVTWIDEPGDRLTQAVFADVVRLSNGMYRMYFQSRVMNNVGIGSAVSTDGITWTREPGLRLQAGGEQGTVVNIGGQSTVQLLDGSWLMTYIGSDGSMTGAGASIYWATSKDGVKFTKQGMALNGAPLAKYNVGYDGSELVRWDDGTIKLYFRGEQGIERILFNGTAFSISPVLVIANRKPGSFPDVPGDPTLARYGGRWHLFHGSGPQMSPANAVEGIYEAGYVAPAKTTIVCMKKTVTKKVTGVSPACPRGYALATQVVCKKGTTKKRLYVVGLACPKGYTKI